MNHSPKQSSEKVIESTPSAWTSGQAMVIWVIWLTYGSLYLCRQNLSLAADGIKTDLGIDKEKMGSIFAAAKIAYAVGQLVNGQLAERLSARTLLAFGMLGSVACNVVFGFTASVEFLIFIWACNGYFQALGWTPCVRVAANWISASQRGRAIGIIGTSYQFMASVTYVVAGYSAYWWGWKWAMFVPAIMLTICAIHMLLFLRESPDTAVEKVKVTTGSSTAATWQDNLWATVTNPALWVLAVALFLLDACRYGFQDWGPTHLIEVQKAHVNIAGLKYAVMPAGGIVGALLAGWVTDRVFAGRRAPAIFGFLVFLGLLTLVYDRVCHTNELATIVVLFFVGLAIFGPQTLLVGTAPTDVARQGTAAAAAGFVNFMGYMGAFSSDKITGMLSQRYGWQPAIWFWAGCSFLGAIVISLLWNRRPNQR
jgi:OPA family glycerol-3-phosphate transporter-like MFS transporter